MFYFTLLLNFLLTGFINLTPALIIRYLIHKKRFEKKNHAIVTSIVIAVIAWTIVYALLSLEGVDHSLPTGAPEILYAYINYHILKPAYQENDASPEDVSHMKENGDNAISKKSRFSSAKLPKLSIAMNVVLCISLIASTAFCFSLNDEVNLLRQDLAEANEKYEISVNARNSMQQRYEEEIEELYKKNNPSSIDFEEESRKIKEENRKEVGEWNKNNPDDQIDYAGNPIE